MILNKKTTASMLLVLFASLAFVLSACGSEEASSEEEQGSQTLAAVQERDSLLCGVSTGLAGFSNPDSTGNWSGLDVDACRAVAAAVLGDSEKVTYVPLTAKERFTALQSGEVDMLSRNTTWTLSRDTSLGLNFTAVVFYDGQGFMVKRALNVATIEELDNVTVCVQAGTTTELNLADYFRAERRNYTPITFETSQQSLAGFENGRCDALTSDSSQLAALRVTMADPSSAAILSGIISKEPLGPVVRRGDEEWFGIVKWTVYAMLEAEEYGISSENVDSVRSSSPSPSVSRFLGLEGEFGTNMGLDNEFAYRIISQVGNYGESFDRNVGSGSPLNIPRGVNNLWTNGGLMYPMPFR